MVNYNIEDEPMIIHKSTMDTFLAENKRYRSDLISLYLFYYYTAKWQKTNQPKATSGYTMKGLGWGRERFSNAKNKLLELKLIEDKKSYDGNNRITGHYIYVKFIWSNSTLRDSYSMDNQHKDSTLRDSYSMDNPEGNALSLNNKYISLKNPSNFDSRPYYYQNSNGIPASYFRFCEQIQNIQIQNHPSKFKQYSKNKLLKINGDGGKTIDKLVRLDNFNFQSEIKPCVLWAVKNDFWTEQIRSLAPLRNKSKNNGEMKFTNIFDSWKSSKKNSKTKPKMKQSEMIFRDSKGRRVDQFGELVLDGIGRDGKTLDKTKRT
jgi:hypothetical protein